MKFFLDTEFIERGFTAPIDLISIGIVAEDGRELYLEHADADFGWANTWVQTNVVPRLGPYAERKSMAQIARLVLAFVGADEPEFWGWCAGYDYVLLSQLIGFSRWPEHWPFYIRDIQQEADRLGAVLSEAERDERRADSALRHNALDDAREIQMLHHWLAARDRRTSDGDL